MTPCCQKELELGKPFLDFIICANTSYLSPLQLQLFLDYFDRVLQKTPEGERVFLHSGTLFYLEKEC